MKIIHTSKKFLKILACATILLTAHQAKAQQVTVDASIDSLPVSYTHLDVYKRQAKQFTLATEVTSMAITKLDGTAKGGVVIGISDQFKIPVK